MSWARLRASVTGTVQGVGFRAFVLREANGLHLTGYVKNEYDGSVSVVAEGPREQLEELLARLRRGPRAASVRDVSPGWSEPSREFGDFGVRF